MKKTITFFRLLPVILLALLLTGSGVKSWATVVTHTFSATSGTIDDNISFTTQQNNGTNAPLFTSGSLRLYYNSSGDGCSLTLTPSNGVIITEVKIIGITRYLPTIKYNVDGGSDGTASLNSTTYTITGISALSSLKIRNANTSNTALRTTSIEVTYTPGGTPDIALADNGTQVADADVSQGTTAVVLHKFQLGVTSASASLTGMTCTTTGTYAAADITNLKVRYSADATLDGADATLSTFTNPGTAGSKTFPSFTSRSIASGTTGYIFITADVAATATHNNTIAVDAITTDNLTFSSGNKTGPTTAGGAQTFKDVTAPTVTTYSPADGNTAVTVNQNLVLTFNENVKRGASGSIVIYNSGGTAFETIPYDDSRITFSTNTVTINPTGTFDYSSDYYVQTTGNLISDMYDNNYAGISDATTWNFTTECGPVTLPYSQDFTTYLPNTCWTEKTGLLEAPSTLTEANSAWAADGFANNGSTGSAKLNIWGTSVKEWLITPTIDLGSTTDYQMEFDLALTTYNATTNPATTGTDDKFAVVISTDNGATWTSANTLRIWDNSGSTDVYNNLTPAGTHVTISLADYTGWVKIGFYGESTVSNAGNDLFIDNLSVVQLATCITPTVVATSDVTAISATISWVASSSNPANGYQYELRTSGAAGSGATGLVTSGTTAAGVVSKAITDLVPNTAYNVFVRSDCGAGDFSAWTNVYSFSTPNLAAPTATAATAISTTGFTANWEAVVSATAYELDVYQGGVIMNENFNTQSGTGGNDGLWSGTIASATISGLSTWTLANAAGGSSCIKLGSSSKLGSATTPELGFTGNAKLSFRAAAWDGTSESTTLMLAITEGTLSNTSVTLVKGQFSNYEVTITGATASSKISFSGLNASNSRFFLDDVVVSNKTSVSGAPFTVTETTKAVTGLTANSAYYYAVVAKNGSATSANSNTVTAFTAIAGTVNASAMPDCPTCDVVVATGGTLTVNADKTYNKVTVNPGGKLTLANGKTLTAPLTIESNAENGTGTYVDENTGTGLPAITGTVQQWLTGKTGTSTRANWYLSSPVNGATANVFDVASLTNKITYYDETVPGYVTQITDNSTELAPGRGYVTYIGGADAAYTFTGGTLNNGDITITPTRTGTTAAKRGFNLVGNPYPSYLDWNSVALTKTKLRSTIWYRTLLKDATAGQMTFDTFDGTTGTTNGQNGEVSQFIPPMQAFWVKVNADGDVASLVFRNAARLHKDQSLAINRLRAPSQATELLPIVRLKVSNGIFSDEAIIVGDNNATDLLDAYDSEKMTNNNTAIPEIATLAGNQELVINHLNSISAEKQLTLGFRPGQTGTNFTIEATQLENIDAKVMLLDKVAGTEQELTAGTPYSFTVTDAAATTDRFVISFAAKVPTGIETGSASGDMTVYTNRNNRIQVIYRGELNDQATVSVYNVAGLMLSTQKLSKASTELSGTYRPGVYMIQLNNGLKKATQKLVIK